MHELSQRLTLMEKQYATVDASYRQRLEELQRSVALEGKAREGAIQDVIKSVSHEISTTARGCP